MKKVLIWIFWILCFFIISVVAAWLYKFNYTNDDIYVETSSGSIVQLNDIIQLSSSIVPISSALEAIGGDYVEVYTIIPAGVSPHGFDLSAKDMVQISESQKIFMIGLDAVDGFLEDATDENKQIHLADGIELLDAEAHSHEEDEHGDESQEDEHHDEEHTESESDKHHEDEGHGHDKDAHVWLGKENIVVIVEKIRDELASILPEQAEYFSENTDKFIDELNEIYSEFSLQTAWKTPREFIVFHDAYNYLMQSVGMDSSLRIPFSENVLHETGTAHIAELIEEIELHGVTHVFREPQFSEGNLQKFANQYNLEIGILDPLWTDSSSTGYLHNLRSNLASLSKIYE